VIEVTQEAAGHESLILHTLVSHDLRDLMLVESRRRGVDAMDLMGPMLDRLAAHLRRTPAEEPGLFDQLMRARAREIEAVEFAFQHDDGLHAQDLRRAEIVLVGASRTMKTPTSLFLAYQGWFVGNVPLVPEVPLNPILKSLPSERVLCLFMSLARLRQLRQARMQHLPMIAENYASRETVRREIRHSQEVSVEHFWQQIDVTGKSVEEVAREVVSLLPATARVRHARQRLGAGRS
jgi:regulator of PEP synthase PpsR (kinase-PPPase family)